MAESEQPTKKRRTSDNKKERWGESVKDYPEAYTKIPAPVKEKKPGQLTQDQINQFFNEVGWPSTCIFFSRNLPSNL